MHSLSLEVACSLSLGAAIEKARPPYVEVVDLGTVSKPCEVERKLRDDT